MLPNQSLIEHIYNQNSDYNSPESALNQANALDTLSTDIYSDDKRFIYELLQNADDASCTSGILDLQIDLFSRYIAISHRGDPFNEIDIESICSIGDGNKQGDENKTGFKGIGFKSVFSHSNYVIIKSGQYCFRFDEKYWNDKWFNKWGEEKNWKAQRAQKNKSSELKMPWQIIPISTDLPLKFNYILEAGYKVSTIIKLNDGLKLEGDLKKLFSNTQILLFLRSPEIRLRFTRKGKTIFKIEKIKKEGTVQLKKNEVAQSNWLLRAFEFEIDSYVKEKIKHDIRIPKKLREASRTEISLAIQLENNSIKKVEKHNRLIFTYLPTSVNFDFPFLINASFLTDAGRQHLHEDWIWNQWLFRQIPIKLFTWISELASKESLFRTQFFAIIPSKLSGLNNLRKSFNIGFDEAIKSIAFIPNISGELLKVKEALFDKSNLSSFIKKKTIAQYINQKKDTTFSKRSFIPDFKYPGVLKRLGVHFFEFEDLIEFFISDTFRERHKLDENFDLIEFLHKQSSSIAEGEVPQWNSNLRLLPFIFDEDEILVNPKLIYFPSLEHREELQTEIHIIHPEVVKKVYKDQEVKNWLISLGVQEPSDLSFIEKTILNDEDFVTIDNAISVGRYLFNAHKNKHLEDWHYRKLQKVKLLTKSASLVNSEASFLPNFFGPELELESICDKGFYVSEAYLQGSELKSEWKTFFIKIGVNENIQVQRVTASRNRDLDKIELQYFIDVGKEASEGHSYPHLVSSYNSVLIDKIAYSEFAREDLAFAKMFWQKVFEKVDPKSISQVSLMPWGYYGSNTLVMNYFHWALKNSKYIPTSSGQILIASEVFINHNEILEIGGKYLPVFDCAASIPSNWLEYLPFKESLKLEDYLGILRCIWMDENIDEDQRKENKKRISLIYEKLGIYYLNYIQELHEWGKVNKLLSKDGKSFYYPSELSVVTVEGFNANHLAFCDEKNDKTIELLRIFGVSIIDNVKADISNSRVQVEEFRSQLFDLLPLMVTVAMVESNRKRDWETEFNRLSKKLDKIRFFQVNEIHLTYGNDDDRQKRSTWADGNDFFYIGNWFKPRVLHGLVDPLGKFLKIRNAEKHLAILLSDSFIEGLEYVKEKFGEEILEIIPDRFLNPPSRPSDPILLRTGGGYTKSKVDIGKRGELFVYDSLKAIYKRKYQEDIIETDFGFKIGHYLEVNWTNIGGVESGLNYDFLIKEKGKEIYVESKATAFSEGTEHLEFELTINEFKLMKSAEKYFVARVFNVTTEPKMKLVRLKLDKL